jgi:hypothetical protein
MLIHKKWQYHLFKMLKEMAPMDEMRSLIDALWKKYPKGLVAQVTKGKVPEQCRGLARYLAKYVASPPMACSLANSKTGSQAPGNKQLSLRTFRSSATIIVSAMCILMSVRAEVSKGREPRSCFDTSARTDMVRPKR